MNATLVKALVAFLPAALLVAGSSRMLVRRTTAFSLQLVGAGCLLVVVLTHICEALRLFPRIGWGEAHSIWSLPRLSSAILGFTLLPMGYFFHRRERLSAASEH
jgi:hypothetical protein